MTILILYNDPTLCANALDDVSLDKMIKSIAQILCNAHYWTDHKAHYEGHCKIICKCKVLPLKLTEKNDYSKWELWVIQCRENYLCLVELGFNLYTESVFRFGITKYNAKYRDIIRWCYDNVPDLPDNKDFTYVNFFALTELPLVMHKKYIGTARCPCCDEGYEELDCICFPLKYSIDDVILSYRNYYQSKLKQKLKGTNPYRDADGDVWYHGEPPTIKWTNRKKPDWLEI